MNTELVKAIPHTERQKKIPRALAGALLLLSAACATTSPDSKPTANAEPGKRSTASLPATPQPSETATCHLAGSRTTGALHTTNGSVNLSGMVGTGVRTGAHTTNGECYERFLIELAGNPNPASTRPGVRAEYVKPPILLDPSDQVAPPIAGNNYLSVTIGAWMYRQGGGTGPQEFTPTNVQYIKQARLTQNFEGINTWTIGVDAERSFTLHEVVGSAGCTAMCVAIDFEVLAASNKQ